MSINKDKLPLLFSKLRTRLINSGKFQVLSDKIIKNIETSYFFNKSKVICIYNNYNSIPLTNILNNESNYYKNTFVFPKLEDSKLSFYYISCLNDLIKDNLGAIDVSFGVFNIDITEIDVI